LVFDKPFFNFSKNDINNTFRGVLCFDIIQA